VEHLFQFKLSVKHWFGGMASTDICNSCTCNKTSQSPCSTFSLFSNPLAL